MKEPRKTSISSTCMPIPSTTIAGARQHPCNTHQWNVLPRVWSLLNVLWKPLISQCTRLYDVPCTHNVGLPTQNRFNVGPASQAIAGSMPADCIRRWFNLETELGDCSVFFLTAIWVTLYPRKATSQITRYIGPIVKYCWATVCDAGPTFFHPKPFKLLTTNLIVNIFFWRLSKHESMEIMFIRIGVQKCQPFPTYGTLHYHTYGNFRRHSSCYLTIHDGNFRRIYYNYTRILGSWHALWPGSEVVKIWHKQRQNKLSNNTGIAHSFWAG